MVDIVTGIQAGIFRKGVLFPADVTVLSRLPQLPDEL
jgi:hypothetical protein